MKVFKYSLLTLFSLFLVASISLFIISITIITTFLNPSVYDQLLENNNFYTMIGIEKDSSDGQQIQQLVSDLFAYVKGDSTQITLPSVLADDPYILDTIDMAKQAVQYLYLALYILPFLVILFLALSFLVCDSWIGRLRYTSLILLFSSLFLITSVVMISSLTLNVPQEVQEIVLVLIDEATSFIQLLALLSGVCAIALFFSSFIVKKYEQRSLTVS